MRARDAGPLGNGLSCHTSCHCTGSLQKPLEDADAVVGMQSTEGGRSVAVPALVGNQLPLGRHATTLAALRATFVDDPVYLGSVSRPAIWDHFLRANEVLQSVVTVHSAWIGGSFTTMKQDPEDIDVLYVVNLEDRATRSPDERRVIEAFQNRVRHPATGRMVPEHGLSVDSFILDWAPHTPPDSGDMRDMTPEYSTYALLRGYWDDWWARHRVGAKTDPAVRGDAVPSRGYLEVQFSDYV